MPKGDNAKLAPAEEGRRLRDYRAGLNDHQIASRSGCTPHAIKIWRDRCGLPTKYAGPHISDEKRTERLRLYSLGYTDLQISEEEGVNRSSIIRWRQTLGLTSNAPERKSRRVLLSCDEEQRRREAYDSGMNDKQIARMFGMSRSAIRYWRVIRNLPANTGSANFYDDLITERMRLYSLGYSDLRIARAQGTATITITGWRHRHGLPANFKKSIPLSAPLTAERMRLYSLGYSDRRIAREQGVSATSIGSWRARKNLPPNAPEDSSLRALSPHRHQSTFAYNLRQKMPVFDRIMRCLPSFLPPADREDAASEVFLAVMSCEINVDGIARHAKKVANRVYSQFSSKFCPRSLDEDLGDEPGFSLLHTLRDERSSGWLEDMGATAW